MAVNDKAYFYYRSYCDIDVTGYTISGDFTDNANATDRNKNTSAITDGEDTDGNSVDFIVDMQYDREVDTIVLRSNLDTFTLYYWDGAAYQSIQAYSSNTATFIVLSFTEVTTSRIKITATHTITANSEKEISILEITKEITNMYLEEMTINESVTKANYETIRGGSVQVNEFPNYPKIMIDLNWTNLNGTDFTAYNALKAAMRIDSFNIYVYFSDTYNLLNIQAYYLVNDESDYLSDPSTPTLASGVNGEMLLQSV